MKLNNLLLKTVLVVIILVLLYLILRKTESFTTDDGCYPDTYRVSAYQQYINKFHGKCTTDSDEVNDFNSGSVNESNGNSGSQCVDSVRATALESHESEPRGWCEVPDGYSRGY